MSSSAKVCAQCGKKQRTTSGFELLLIVGSLVVLISYYGFEGNKDTPHHVIQPGPVGEVATTPSPVPTPQPRHAIGEEFSVGYWSYRCNGATWKPFISSGFGSIERPDAEFLIVDLLVQNNDRTASTLPPLKLVDAQGREFDESSKGSLLNGSFDILKRLNPGVSSRGFVVFDAPHGEYALKVSGGILSGKDALIDLPSERRQESGQESPQAAPTPEPPAHIDQSSPNPGEPNQAPERTRSLPETAVPQSQSAPDVASISRAAEEGNASAQYDLGTLYENGRGMPQDLGRAVYLYRKAADKGYSNAQFDLGVMFYEGRSVPQDYGQAYFWLALAASGTVDGVKQEDVEKWRDNAASQLSPETLAQREEGVRKWLEHPPKVD